MPPVEYFFRVEGQFLDKETDTERVNTAMRHINVLENAVAIPEGTRIRFVEAQIGVRLEDTTYEVTDFGEKSEGRLQEKQFTYREVLDLSREDPQ